MIASLGEHRVLSTAQVQAIHLPGRSRRRAQQLLADLESTGLVGGVKTPRSRDRLWYLTEDGAELAVSGGGLPRRPKLIGPREAAGPLSAHTRAVNEVGIAFLRAARGRGDDFGPLSWRHEVAHPLNRGRGRARRTLFADSLLTYLRLGEESVWIEQRFVELDRATLAVDRLAAELARYGELERATDGRGEPVWERRYPVFPPVLCVLTGASPEALRRRRRAAIALLRRDPQFSSAGGPRISFCLLEELRREGPFAPIFRTVAKAEGRVNWIEEGGPEDEADGTEATSEGRGRSPAREAGPEEAPADG